VSEATTASAQHDPPALFGELRKLGAFGRRDLLVAWSYRMSFVTDWVGLAVQIILFGLISKLIDPSKIPAYGGTQATYMQFVVVGIALGVFLQIGLHEVVAGIRQEQLMGTLESLLVTPTAPATIQLGSVVYQLIYIPLRTAIFLIVVSWLFGLHFHASGLAPSALILFVFVGFVWGLGVISAAGILTYRRGAGALALGVGMLTLLSAAYFPLDVLPHWLSVIASANPVTIAIDGMRDSLIGGTGWSDVWPRLAVLAPISAIALLIGVYAFRRALRREQRLGTLGLY
jgi:ABC-2 type transport system permease protein